MNWFTDQLKEAKESLDKHQKFESGWYEQRIVELEKTLEVVEKQRDRFIAKQKERIADLEKENEMLRDILNRIEDLTWIYKHTF